MIIFRSLFSGLSYILFPTSNANYIFGNRLLKSAAPIATTLIQGLGGLCIILASTFCTASQLVTVDLCKSVSLGFFINVALKAFSLITGWSGNVNKVRGVKLIQVKNCERQNWIRIIKGQLAQSAIIIYALGWWRLISGCL